MRPLLVLSVFMLSLAATTAVSAADLPESGFLVFKDAVGSGGTVEVRDNATGRVVDTLEAASGQADQHSECTDARRATFAAWQTTPTYRVNVDTIPAYLSSALARAQLVTSQEAWEDGFTTDCTPPSGTNTYDADEGETTNRLPTLVTELKTNHENTVGFVPLDDTVCAGALACVIADFTGHRINEADLALDDDLRTPGRNDVWTTSPTTWRDETGGEFALLDVATHEFGHFAGLGHALKSPELTMYPIIHDGDQTLGLGDMKGILTLY